MSRAELLEAWGEHLATGRRRSPHTVRAYVTTAARWLDQTGAESWSQVARMDIRDLRTQLAARRADGIGNVSAARELSALKGFLAFAREQAGDPNPALPRLRGPRIKKGLPRPVTPAPVQREVVQSKQDDGPTRKRSIPGGISVAGPHSPSATSPASRAPTAKPANRSRCTT